MSDIVKPGDDSFLLPRDLELSDGTIIPGAVVDPRTIKTIGICECFRCGKKILLPEDQLTLEHSAFGGALYAHRLCIVNEHAVITKMEFLSAIQDIVLKRRITNVVDEILKMRGGS